jgi:hypothetical protein
MTHAVDGISIAQKTAATSLTFAQCTAGPAGANSQGNLLARCGCDAYYLVSAATATTTCSTPGSGASSAATATCSKHEGLDVGHKVRNHEDV